MEVSNSVRDLGAHLSTTKALKGTTLTKRVNEATTTANRLARVVTTQQNKVTVVRTKVLPKTCMVLKLSLLQISLFQRCELPSSVLLDRTPREGLSI